MRCMACGGEMILMNVVPDDTMEVPGFEQHTFTCSECQDVERRLVFTTHSREGDTACLRPCRRHHPSRLLQQCRMSTLLLQVS